jgi:uracil-DNA glycosylase
MSAIGTFPFGQPVNLVTQQDRTPKLVFVLGVYASAVHARWIGPDGKDVVKALAVASEPCIFWCGDGAEKIISEVPIPKELGTLVPAADEFNGPSGVALDDLFLKPLGLTRGDAWLCDLVPHSCVNPAQQKAIERAYVPLLGKHGLPAPCTPGVPRKLADDDRRKEILTELRESKAKVLVLLGDQPIKWFLAHFDSRWKRLADFKPYGALNRAAVDGVTVAVLPLVHPRQAAKLGQSSPEWYEKHRAWIKEKAAGLLAVL